MDQNQATRGVADVAVKLALVSFVALFAFSIGTYVGKQFSDLEYKRAALEGEDSQRLIASLEEQIEPSISKEEVEALAEEFVRKERSGRGLSNVKGEKKDEPTEANDSFEGYKKMGSSADPQDEISKDPNLKDPNLKEPNLKGSKTEQPVKVSKPTEFQPVKNPPLEAAQRIAEDKEPSKPVVQKREPARTLPGPVAASALGKYTVQVASYSSEDEAQSHTAKLKDKGWQAFYIPAKVGGRTWYRVSVGLFESPSSAKSFQSKLNEEASVSGTLIQRIVQ